MGRTHDHQAVVEAVPFEEIRPVAAGSARSLSGTASCTTASIVAGSIRARFRVEDQLVVRRATSRTHEDIHHLAEPPVGAQVGMGWFVRVSPARAACRQAGAPFAAANTARYLHFERLPSAAAA